MTAPKPFPTFEELRARWPLPTSAAEMKCVECERAIRGDVFAECRACLRRKRGAK